MATWDIDGVDLTSEVIWRPAAWPQRPQKIVVRGNMHMDTRVIEVTDFKSEVKFEVNHVSEF